MNKIKLNTINNKPNYIENDQTSSICFSPVYIGKQVDPLYKNVEGEYCQAWYPVKCRDKLNDLPNILKLGLKIMDTNGFIFNYPEIFKDYGDTLMMSVSFENKEDHNSFINKFKLFTDLESKYNLRISEIVYTNRKHTLLIKSDIFWTQSPVHISLYSFLLRILSYGSLEKEYVRREKTPLPELETIHQLLSFIRKMFINDDLVTIGIDGSACELLLTSGTSLDELMFSLPIITSEEPITGFNDKSCIDILCNADEWSTPKIKGTFEYESDIIKRTKINYTFFRWTSHYYSGFYSLLSAIPYILKGTSISQRIKDVPIWTLKYIETLYNNGFKFNNNFSLINFKSNNTGVS